MTLVKITNEYMGLQWALFMPTVVAIYALKDSCEFKTNTEILALIHVQASLLTFTQDRVIHEKNCNFT